MDREYLQKTVEEVEKSIETSKENKKRAENHIEEGEIILEALRKKLTELS